MATLLWSSQTFTISGEIVQPSPENVSVAAVTGQAVFYRSSYPDRKEGEEDAADEELPDEKTLEYDDEMLELTLPSGEQTWRILYSCFTANAFMKLRQKSAQTAFRISLWEVLRCVYVWFNVNSRACLCFSGAKIGHRSLMRYYKQRFGAERAVVLSHNKNAVGRVLRQYRALGWGGQGERQGLVQETSPTRQIQRYR